HIRHAAISSSAVGGLSPTSLRCPHRHFVSGIPCMAGEGRMGQSDRCGHLGIHVLFFWAVELATLPLYATRRLRKIKAIGKGHLFLAIQTGTDTALRSF